MGNSRKISRKHTGNVWIYSKIGDGFFTAIKVYLHKSMNAGNPNDTHVGIS